MQLESFSYSLFWCGLILTVLATATFALAAWGRRVVVRQAATDAGSVTISSREPLPLAVGRFGTAFTWGALLLLLSYLATRTVATDRPPFSDMFEYLAALGTLTVGFYAAAARRYRQRSLGAAAMSLALLLLLLAQALFSPGIAPLMPALQNNRLLAAHVACMVISYGALTLAFVAAVLHLIQTDANRFPSLPKARQLETLTYRAVLTGFPLLSLGIALGAYWANIAWGRYWGWDPKETTALVTWLVFAGYLHARSLAGWRGRRAALIVVAGWLMITFNILGVNFWISGLHSYAGR